MFSTFILIFIPLDLLFTVQIENVVNQKEIRIEQKEKQKDELLAFGKKPLLKNILFLGSCQ